MANIPTGGVQINELPESSTIQSKDKLVIDRDGEDYSVTASQFSDKVEGTVSDAFSSTKAYSAGDYCIYNDVLYKFTSNKSAGAWDGSVAEATTVGGEIAELSSDISSLKSVKIQSQTVSVTTSQYGLVSHGKSDLIAAVSNNTSYGIFICGTTIRIYTVTSNSSFAWATNTTLSVTYYYI